jgi:hypothetical protein
LLATSVAYADELDAVPSLDYANRALAACQTAREHGDAEACPDPEEVRMELYQQHLDAGVKSGIDPRKGPAAAAAFRRAGEAALRQIRLVPDREPARASGSPRRGSGSSAP